MCIGNTVKEALLEVIKANSFGLLIDEATDIATCSQLISFVQYVNSSGNTEVKFLGIKDVLQTFDSCNAAAIIKEFEDNHLNLEKLNGLATDGASVMLGKHNGVAAKLKEKAPALVNVHCVCHKLALACVDSVSSLNFIKNVETMLRQLWQWFENSPKRMAALLSVQVNVKASKNLSK